jgi:hypothetical protein
VPEKCEKRVKMNIKKHKTLEDFIDMEQLELKYYSEEHVTPHEEAYRWNQSNPDTGFVMEDNGRIVAFSDILPVKKEIFRRIAEGKFNDKYLTAEDLVSMNELKKGDKVDLLLSCILVDEDYRETDALKTLLNAHLDYYQSFEEKGIHIDAVLTSNVTMAGERFSERMGFERIGRSEHQTTLYRTSFRQLCESADHMRFRLEEKLLQFENDLLDPDFCSDIDKLEHRFAAGFVEYGQSGAVYGRDAMIRFLLASKKRNIEIRNFTVRCLGSSAAVANFTAVEGLESGKSGMPGDRSLRTSVWVKEEGDWRIFFHQGTAIRE